jgi:hypothetical protein
MFFLEKVIFFVFLDHQRVRANKLQWEDGEKGSGE